MKLTLFFSILSLLVSVASARSFDDEFAADLDVRFISWCAGSNVMTEEGNSVRLVRDCSLSRTHGRCVEQRSQKGRSILVSATCQPWNYQVQIRRSCAPLL